MTARIIAFAAILAGVTLVTAPARASGQAQNERPDDVVRRFYDHLSRNETDSVIALTAADFVLNPGAEAIDRDRFRRLLEVAVQQSVAIELTGFETVADDSVATATYRCEVRVRPDQGEGYVRTTTETAVLRRVAGRWLISTLTRTPAGSRQ